ncbi:MAG: transporter substrate-binding domain-containing protein [Rhodospirillales bacterium]|nr:transporter substrate-binding domain-containing protein [Rhodospirillales bacterium]
MSNKLYLGCVLALIASCLMGPKLVWAQTSLVLVTPPNRIDTVISEVITREAYKRIGIAVKIRKYPGERALRLANSGKVDGEVQRINGIAANYHNLIQVHPAINYIEGTVFTRTKNFDVKGWQSLRPYRIGYIRGIKFAERNTKNMDSSGVGDYSRMFQMLGKGRFEIIVSPRLNGLYQMKQLGITGVRVLTPAIMRFDLFHYLHKKHSNLVPKISAVFAKMSETGELAKIRKHVISVTMKRAEQKLPLCDKDYACFD